MFAFIAVLMIGAGVNAQSIARSVAVSGPGGSYVSTYGINGGTASATAAGPKGKISCESPKGPQDTKVVCSGELPKNVTQALYIYSKVKGEDWCLKECEQGVDCGVSGQNVILSTECDANSAWYFDEKAGLRLVHTTKCAAVNLDEYKQYSFVGDVCIEEEKCEEEFTQWYFEGYNLKNRAFDEDLCLTVCVAEDDGCNTIAYMDTHKALNVAFAPCVEDYNAQLFVPAKIVYAY